jgi:hypothetical protein
MVRDQLLHPPLEVGVPGTGLVNKLPALRLGTHLHGGGEDRFNRTCSGLHGQVLERWSALNA